MLYIPLKQKISLIRNRTELMYDSLGLDSTLAISQHLDALIYKVFLIRHGRFCCNRTNIAARRKARRHRYRSRAAS